MRAIEIQTKSLTAKAAHRPDVLPAQSKQPNAGTVPGPDVIVGDLPPWRNLEVAEPRSAWRWEPTPCNNGTVELGLVSVAKYRPSGHPAKSLSNERRRHEQRPLRTDWSIQRETCVHGLATKHLRLWLQWRRTALILARAALILTSELKFEPERPDLGSRAWINPFTGAYPITAANTTTAIPTIPVLPTEFWWRASDLNTTLNPGATYYAEAQYVTPHEYAWCQANPGNATCTTMPPTVSSVSPARRVSPFRPLDPRCE